MQHQIVEQTIFQRGQAQRLAIDAGARRARIEADAAANQQGLSMTGRAAHQGAQTRQQFFGMKRLGQIVVGAGVEARHLVAPGAARRQDQNRRRLAVTPPAFQHRDAVDLGQAEIENDAVIGLGVAQEVRFFAVRGMVDDIAGIAERSFQLARQVGIVFGKQDAQVSLSM